MTSIMARTLMADTGARSRPMPGAGGPLVRRRRPQMPAPDAGDSVHAWPLARPRATVPGVDVERVTQWFADHVAGGDPAAPVRPSSPAGARTSPSGWTDADGHAFALRRPPLGHVLPTAHDMAREHRLIAALGPSGVPVPDALGLCNDEAVNGSPFHVMEFVEGHVLRDAERPTRWPRPRGPRREIGDHLADTLATLHSVDPDAVGLGDLAKHDGYIDRQLRRWTRSTRTPRWRGSTTAP